MIVLLGNEQDETDIKFQRGFLGIDGYENNNYGVNIDGNEKTW